MPRSVVGSLALHLGAILLILFGLPWLHETPAPIEQIVPVNLVELGEKNASPASTQVAPLPQQQASETAPSTTAAAVPPPQTPPSPDTARAEPPKSKPDLRSTAVPAANSTVPSAMKALKPATAAATPHRQPSPADALAARLKTLAQLRQPPAPIPPSARQQAGTGISSTTAASADTSHGVDASYRVKDFIRAQVERRWNLDPNIVRGVDWTVSIRIVLDQSGRVLEATIVDDPRFADNKAYRDFALSARNAVLLSSPLLLPPGVYDIAKDIVVDFDARQVSR